MNDDSLLNQIDDFVKETENKINYVLSLRNTISKIKSWEEFITYKSDIIQKLFNIEDVLRNAGIFLKKKYYLALNNQRALLKQNSQYSGSRVASSGNYNVDINTNINNSNRFFSPRQYENIENRSFNRSSPISHVTTSQDYRHINYDNSGIGVNNNNYCNNISSTVSSIGNRNQSNIETNLPVSNVNNNYNSFNYSMNKTSEFNKNTSNLKYESKVLPTFKPSYSKYNEPSLNIKKDNKNNNNDLKQNNELSKCIVDNDKQQVQIKEDIIPPLISKEKEMKTVSEEDKEYQEFIKTNSKITHEQIKEKASRMADLVCVMTKDEELNEMISELFGEDIIDKLMNSDISEEELKKIEDSVFEIEKLREQDRKEQ